MKQGEKVALCALEREDLILLQKWRNNEKFKKYFREYRELNYDMQELWYETKVLKDKDTLMFGIHSLEDNTLLGCCGLCYINWVHRHADLSLYIGYEEAYIDETGIAKESCELLFEYAFDQLGLNKIWTEIYDFDYPKKKLYFQLGFHLDGILRNHYFYDGKWNNAYILSLLSKDW